MDSATKAVVLNLPRKTFKGRISFVLLACACLMITPAYSFPAPQAAESVHITLMGTTDLHAHIEPVEARHLDIISQRRSERSRIR
jgi:2',3'-cyclic-nucleotide 2'-phosphodiesterase (5'-nucleotidase family)